MHLTSPLIKEIFEKSQKEIKYSKDPYKKLVEFEKALRDYYLVGAQTRKEQLECRKVLACINSAQIKIIEKEVGEDIDGDGEIGFDEWIY